ncbi:MAG: glycoside hydrolase family 16 protein [Asticcacaulis sp.]
MPAGYDLVWSDEFNATGLPDETNWLYDTEANRTGWYNNEKQYYAVRRAENSKTEDGLLKITAYKETITAADHGGQAYTSARLITRGKREFTYGFYEIRAKMPCGVGTWPAIWMLGTTANWPDGGEIDIMEHVGQTPEKVFGTIHNRSTYGTWGVGAEKALPDACNQFHNFQIEWTDAKIDFFIDGVKYHTYTNAGTGNAQWPFDKPMYLLLNMAIGGDMAGPVDDSIFPRTFEIDYVRVYQKP